MRSRAQPRNLGHLHSPPPLLFSSTRRMPRTKAVPVAAAKASPAKAKKPVAAAKQSAAKPAKRSSAGAALADADLDGLDAKLLAKLESAKEISRDSLRKIIKASARGWLAAGRGRARHCRLLLRGSDACVTGARVCGVCVGRLAIGGSPLFSGYQWRAIDCVASRPTRPTRPPNAAASSCCRRPWCVVCPRAQEVHGKGKSSLTDEDIENILVRGAAAARAPSRARRSVDSGRAVCHPPPVCRTTPSS